MRTISLYKRMVQTNERRPRRGANGSGMSPKIMKRMRLAYGIVLSVLILAAGGALILACLSVFHSPAGTFSRETVATAFGRIAVLVYLAVGGILVGAILSIVFPEEPRRVKPLREDKGVLQKLIADYDLAGLSPDALSAIHRERNVRKKLTILATAASLLLSIPPILWILLPGHFGAGDKNKEIMIASVIVFGCFTLAMLISFVVGVLVSGSCRRERAMIKLAVANRAAVKREASPERPVRFWDKPSTVWAVRGSVLVLSVVFIILGVQNGGMRDVFAKAVRICTECIGLG